MTQDILYLGSQSKSRQTLLKDAGIAFNVLEHSSDEQVSGIFSAFAEQVIAIAQGKMKALMLPERQEVAGDHLFVVTADTLVRTVKTNKILGKPSDRDHAKQMLAWMREESVDIQTGCCLEKLRFNQGKWTREENISWATGALVDYVVDEKWVDYYLDTVPIALHCAGSATIEGVGATFVKSMSGSYTGAIGLPLFELRQNLEKLNFKF